MNTQVAKPKKSHVIFIDILRAIAIFGVISIHGLDQILRFNSDLTSPTWWYANIANSSVRWVLPAFFMISGMLLLAKDEDTLFFLKKRLNKILLPTIIWSGIYGVWIWFQYNRSLSFSEHIVQTVVFGTPYYHLYFLFAILGFYLLSPILSIFTRFASQKRMLYAIGLMFFAACIGNIFMGWQLQVYPNTRLLSLFQWLPFTGYYLAGYYLYAYPLSISNKKTLGLVSFAIFVAIGEIGIDHHEYKNSKYDPSSYEIQAYNALQTSVFTSQLELSISIDKPVIIHSRDAKNEALDYVLETNTRTKKNIRGVFHCYEGSKKMVKHILAAGLYISFTANITYVPDRLDVATLVPLDKLLLETDCPYMSPISIRGKRNSPSSATMIAAAHAQSRNITISQVEAQTDTNAHTLFGLD